MANARPVPEWFHSVTPHMIIKDATGAIEFYRKAFGAKQIGRFMCPGGDLVMHATMKIGDSMIMVADEFPEGQGCPGWMSPLTAKGTTITLQLYVDNVDALYQQALEAGCTASMPPMDAFWGDRFGQVIDPYGHHGVSQPTSST